MRSSTGFAISFQPGRLFWAKAGLSNSPPAPSNSWENPATGSKDGFCPDELRAAFDGLVALPGLDIRGLMTMAPRVEDASEARPYFARLRELRNELATRTHDGASLTELSMGMSGDFEAAIAEGATIVRVGSSLFEGLS
jgi:uncharacterized pyridoxal phosphate-containing UPF0001 family protein